MWPTYWNHLADDPAEEDELHDGMGAVRQLVDLALPSRCLLRSMRENWPMLQR
ncbi:hypothetical protein [Streptomyces avermitilis]|uniref:hypothetical protein n=1 Tax=Streptomyces avermitilis TaxID=33903 RepID=UPI0036CBD6D6